jgi:hypothetical protein
VRFLSNLLSLSKSPNTHVPYYKWHRVPKNVQPTLPSHRNSRYNMLGVVTSSFRSLKFLISMY